MTIVDFLAEKAARTAAGNAASEQPNVWDLQRQAIESVPMLAKWLTEVAAAGQAMERARFTAAAGALASVIDDLQASALHARERLGDWPPRVKVALANAPAESRDDVCLIATIGVAYSFIAAAEAAAGVLLAVEGYRP